MSKSKLHQDFELSIFLNLLKDMGYYVEELDRSLNKLAVLGKFYYEERKALFLINEAVKKLELELYKQLLVAIEKDKASCAPVVDKWLINFNKFLKKVEDSEHKKLMEYKIVTDISRLNAKPGKKMQLKTLATYIDNLAENKGEFLERICSRIAEIEQAKSSLSFYEIRSLVVQRLPKKLQKIHYSYIYQNTIEVNAERVFTLFEKYENDKDLEGLSRCLLQIFEDDSVFAVFKSKIVPLVEIKAGKFSWKGDFESLIEKRAFKSFLKNVIMSLSPEMRLRYKRFSFTYIAKSL